MHKKSVLIVEDEGIVALNEQQIVFDLGYHVTGIAMTGEDAIYQASRDRPDLILMDIRLYGEMSGRQASLKIRELYQTPLVYVTAYGDKEKSLSPDFSPPEGIGYVVKPFNRIELESEIKRLIG